DGAEQLQGGTPARFVLYWRSERKLDLNYTISAQLGAEGGDRLAQRDSWPWDGYFPTGEWAVGQQVSDPYVLDLPPSLPAGRYALRLGIYYNDNGTVKS